MDFDKTLKVILTLLEETKKYCKNQSVWCKGCVFADNKKQCCILQTPPEQWDINKIKENAENKLNEK